MKKTRMRWILLLVLCCMLVAVRGFALSIQTTSPNASPSPEAFALPTPSPASSPEAAELVSITVTAGGDVTLGGSGTAAKRFMKLFKDNGASWFMQNMLPIFSQDDFTFINLEGPLTTSRTRRKNRVYNFRGNPAYVDVLVEGGIEVAGFSNNHALDYLQAGKTETKQTVLSANVGYCDESTPYIAEKEGVKVGFLAFYRPETGILKMQARIKSLKETCNLVIVSMHSGNEGSRTVTKAQRAYARAMVDAGADLVVGHHPHVIQGIERYKGVTIAYSLGNFCFAGNSDPTDRKALLFQETFTVRDGVVESRTDKAYPILVSSIASHNNFQPMLAPDAHKKQIIKILRKCSKGFDETPDFTTLFD